MKRLVLYLSKFPQLSETFIVNKFLGMLDRGWDIHIVCSNFNQKAWDQFTNLKAVPNLEKKVHKAWPTQPHWLVVFLYLPALVYCLISSPRLTMQYFRLGSKQLKWEVFKNFYLDQALIRIRPNILHFEFGSLAVGKTYLRDLLGTKLSVSFRGFDVNYIGLDKLDFYNDVWKSADGVHLLGQDLWTRAQKRGAPSNFPHSLIAPAVDLSLFPEPSSPRIGSLGTFESPLQIVSIGRLHWKKGYEFSFQAIKILVEMGLQVKYSIIGDGDYKEALYFARHQLGLEKIVTFLGGLTHLDVLDHLRNADVFLHGAVSEGFCNAVLEAQSLGIPVVCTDADGLRDNIEDGLSGFVVPRRNPTAIAEKLVVLASDGFLRQKMSESGKNRVAAYFRMEQQLDSFEKFYDQL